MSEKIIFTTFTDPMMGLTYEMEPIYDRLKREYGDRIEFRWVMSLLVRDVSNFMTSRERAMPPEAGIRAYNARLAQIYKSEEVIGGLPINMKGFCLFDPEHRTSKPLNLACKAAQLTAPEKADDFLINLRHATVIDCRPTTRMDVILDVANKTGIDEALFKQHYTDGTAEAALQNDHAFTARVGIRSLPTCLIQYRDKALLMQSFVYEEYNEAISQLTAAHQRIQK